MKTLYRYEIDYKSIDNDTQVRLREYTVFRETEKTYFIDIAGYPFPRKVKRVLKDAMNTYAYPTKELAKEHFIRRTKKRIAWYNFWIDECKKGLDLIEDEK